MGIETERDDEILVLDKCIYRLVQSARQYHKKTVIILKKIGFEGGEVAPCLYVRKSTKFGRFNIALYEDDNLIVGKEEDTNEVIQELQNEGFTLKVDDGLKDDLSCKIEFSENKNSAWLGQPHLIANLQKSFEDQVKDMTTCLTPGTTHKIQVGERDERKCIFKEEQTLFHLGLGMLLWPTADV